MKTPTLFNIGTYAEILKERCPNLLWSKTTINFLVTKGGQSLDSIGLSNRSVSSSNLSVESLLLSLVCSRSDLSLLLQLGNNVLVLPTNGGRQSGKSGELSTWL